LARIDGNPWRRSTLLPRVDPAPRLARAARATHNRGMRTIVTILFLAAASGLPPAHGAAADEAVYRCQATDGTVSIQTAPCPKGATQRKIPFERPPAPASAPPPPPPPPLVAGNPVTPPSAMRGPNDPYPLWQCMRADGSTFESRDGVPGRQWVPKAETEEPAAEPDAASDSAKIAERLRHGGHMVRHVDSTTTNDDASSAKDRNAPPAGAPPGQWVSDQCTQLEPAQACERYAARRDALRKQIYAAKPSERPQFAPEEQDLTSMLFAACGL
jgi:type IV secretory pathway VirB10-like protein